LRGIIDESGDEAFSAKKEHNAVDQSLEIDKSYAAIITKGWG
jgi:hypothetical protein